MKLIFSSLLILLATVVSTGCSPEVGSEEWCEEMKAKPKGDWTANELGDFTRHCVFK
jgi:hypothetical protein